MEIHPSNNARVERTPQKENSSQRYKNHEHISNKQQGGKNR